MDANTKKNLDLLFDKMLGAGVLRIELQFDGSGDDGSINDVRAISVHGPEIDVDLTVFKIDPPFEQGWGRSYNATTGGWVTQYRPASPEQCNLRGLAETVAYSALEDTGVDWVNNDGGYGTVYIEQNPQRIYVDMNQRFTSTELSQHAFVGAHPDI